MRKLFGTDGVRGVANTELSALTALKLGSASAHVLRRRHEGAQILIGRDPRISGDILESAMASGICAMGVDVHLAGVVPTPAVAYLARQLHMDAGVVISASHNPMRDNGIKFFGADGYKLPDEIEKEIEAHITGFDSLPFPVGAGVGRMYRVHKLLNTYIEHMKSIFPRSLEGLKLVLDCSNGAVYEAAPMIFSQLGAEIIVTNASPDGLNINECCGSLHTETLQKLVLDHNAHAGLAFDGDGDRAILVDEKGCAVDGDRIMAIYALYLAEKGLLPHNSVVATVMSNIGLEAALKQKNISLIRTRVGDRYVVDEMRKTGIVVGGEKSGHLIFSEYSTTGDGIVTSLQMLNIMLETNKPLSELSNQMQEFPQILVNVPVKTKENWERIGELSCAVKAGEERLKGRGRVFVRASGTEKLIRVMAEGPDQVELEEITGEICSIVKKLLG